MSNRDTLSYHIIDDPEYYCLIINVNDGNFCTTWKDDTIWFLDAEANEIEYVKYALSIHEKWKAQGYPNQEDFKP
jgi:hypothetical protein